MIATWSCIVNAARWNPIDSITIAISKEYRNRNVKETVTASFLRCWTYIYRSVVYEVAGRVWGGGQVDCKREGVTNGCNAAVLVPCGIRSLFHPSPRPQPPSAMLHCSPIYLSRFLHYHSWTIASTGLAFHRHVTLRILHMMITHSNVAVSIPLSIQWNCLWEN